MSRDQLRAGRRLGHDLSNQLAIILGFSELLLTEMSTGDPRRVEVLAIDTAARAAMLMVSESLLPPR